MHDLQQTLALSCTFKMAHGTLQAEVDPSNRGATQLYEPGTVIDSKFRIVSLLGEGGMGLVYRAHHLTLGNDVALKTFRFPDLSGETWQRFQREAQAIAKLESKHIVRVFDFGIAQGNQPYYTLELLEGESLADRINRDGALPLSETIMIFTAVAEGLVSAHAKGIVHRDLKPANIFLVQQDNKVVSVKLVDFGIAKLMGAGEHDAQRLTAVGKIFGSPLYMSPEQSIGEDTDQRSDIYSFACAFYETLTGRPPFLGENAFATICSHQNDTPPRLAKGNTTRAYPGWLESLISLMLAKRKEDRVQSFQEVLDVISSNKNSDLQKSSMMRADATMSGELSGNEADDHEDRSRVSAGSNLNFRNATIAVLLIFVVAAAGNIVRTSLWPNSEKTDLKQLLKQSNNAQASVEATDIAKPQPVARFFQRIEPSPKGQMKVFRFPDISVGQFYTGGEFFNKPPKGSNVGLKCMGIVRIPLDDNWTFEPDGRLTKEPSLFDGFQGNDLANMSFRGLLEGTDEWRDVHVHAIAHLSGLKRLSIKTADVDGDAIPDISKLKNLIVLELSETSISGEDLLKLSNLYGLDSLFANRLQHMHEFLKHVDKGRLNVRLVELINDHLKDQDLQELAQIKSIEYLTLDKNHLTDAGVKYLTKLPKLKVLGVNNTDIDLGVIDILGQIKTLETVFLSSPRFSAEDKARLQHLLPRCNVKLTTSGTSLTEGKQF